MIVWNYCESYREENKKSCRNVQVSRGGLDLAEQEKRFSHSADYHMLVQKQTTPLFMSDEIYPSMSSRHYLRGLKSMPLRAQRQSSTAPSSSCLRKPCQFCWYCNDLPHWEELQTQFWERSKFSNSDLQSCKLWTYCSIHGIVSLDKWNTCETGAAREELETTWDNAWLTLEHIT